MLDNLRKWGIEIKEKLHSKKMQNVLLSVSGGAEMGPEGQNGILFFSCFLLAIGFIALVYPRLFWYLRVGRKIAATGATPGRLYLAVLRCGGLMLCALAIWMLFYLR
jgi:hypothetical protein